jgi:hypothetical protein
LRAVGTDDADGRNPDLLVDAMLLLDGGLLRGSGKSRAEPSMSATESARSPRRPCRWNTATEPPTWCGPHAWHGRELLATTVRMIPAPVGVVKATRGPTPTAPGWPRRGGFVAAISEPVVSPPGAGARALGAVRTRCPDRKLSAKSGKTGRLGCGLVVAVPPRVRSRPHGRLAVESAAYGLSTAFSRDSVRVGFCGPRAVGSCRTDGKPSSRRPRSRTFLAERRITFASSTSPEGERMSLDVRGPHRPRPQP